MTFPLLLAIALAGCSVLFSLVLSVVLLRSLRRNSLQQEILEKLKGQVSVLSAGTVGLGQKVIDVEVKLRDLEGQQSELQHSDMDYSYAQAEKLIAQGVDDSSIALNSGLSSSEINLMRLMQTQGKEHEAVA